MSDYNSIFGPYATQSDDEKKKQQSASQLAKVENKQSKYDEIFGNAATAYESIKTNWPKETPVPAPTITTPAKTQPTSLLDKFKTTLTGIINSVNPRKEAEKKLAEVQTPQVDTSKISAASIQPIQNNDILAKEGGQQSAQIEPIKITPQNVFDQSLQVNPWGGTIGVGGNNPQPNKPNEMVSAETQAKLNTIYNKVMEAGSKFQSSIKNMGTIFTPSPIYAPEDVADLNKMVEESSNSVAGKVNKQFQITAAYTQKGLTNDLVDLKPPEVATAGDKVNATASYLAGQIVSFKIISKWFDAAFGKNINIAPQVVKNKTIVSFINSLPKTAFTFDAYGQLNPNQKDRAKTLLTDTITSIPFTAFGLVPNKAVKIPVAFGLGYSMAKVDGASTDEAIQNGLLLASLTGLDVLTSERVTKAKNTLKFTPEELKTMVKERGMEGTPEGDILTKVANTAETQGKNVELSATKVQQSILDDLLGRKTLEVTTDKTKSKEIIQKTATLVDKNQLGEGNRKVIVTPEAAIDMAETTDLKGTKAGEELIKVANEAKSKGVMVEVDTTGQTGTKVTTPGNNTIGIQVSTQKVLVDTSEPKIEEPPKLTTSPEAPQQTKTEPMVTQQVENQSKQTETKTGVLAGVENDISRELANNSHQGLSFSPEKRGEAEIKDYVDTITSDYEDIKKMLKKDTDAKVVDDMFAKYREGMKTRLSSYLSSLSKVYSPMISGPARFPTARMEKLRGFADSKLKDYIDYREYSLNKIRKYINGSEVIKGSDSEVVQKLNKKLTMLKEKQATMVAANKIIRSNKSKSTEYVIDQLVKQVGITVEEARSIMKPDFMNHVGYPSYSMSNNNAKIRMTEQRIRRVEKQKATPVSGKKFDGGRVVVDTQADRIKIVYDQKPPADVISKLKQNGFRWSPSNMAWQRQITTNAKIAVERVTGIDLNENGSKKTSSPSKGVGGEGNIAKAEEINKRLQELSSSPEFQEFYRGGKISGKKWNEYQQLSREYRNLLDNTSPSKGVGGEGVADRYTEIYDRLKNNKVVSSKDKNYVASISRDRKLEADSLLKQLQEDVKYVSDSQSAKDLIDKINQYNQLLDSTPPLNHRLRPTVPEWLMKKAKSNLSVTNNKPSWYSENSPRRAIYGNNKPPESLDNLSESELKKLYNDFMLALQKDKRSSDLYLITSDNRVSKSLEGRKTNEADTLRKEAFNELNAIKDRFYVADEKLPEFADDLRSRIEPIVSKDMALPPSKGVGGEGVTKETVDRNYQTATRQLDDAQELLDRVSNPNSPEYDPKSIKKASEIVSVLEGGLNKAKRELEDFYKTSVVSPSKGVVGEGKIKFNFKKQPTEMQQAQADVAKAKRQQYEVGTLKDIAFIKRLMNLKKYAEGDIETLRKRFGTKISDIVEAVRNAEFNQQLSDDEALQIALSIPTEKETYPGYYPEADMGGYSDVKSRMKELNSIRAIEFPELLRMYQTLTNKVPVLKALRSYLGYHRAGGITLNREIFKDPTIAIKVFAHEFGHLTDFFDDKTMSRGNLLGRIGSLRRYLKQMLPESPTATEGVLTPEDRNRLRKEAKKMVQKPEMVEQEVVIGEQKVTPEEILSIWNDLEAGNKMPDLMDYIKLLSQQEKVEIIKAAIKGIIPDWVNFSRQIKEKKMVEVLRNAPEDVKRKYQELVREEVRKRKLFALQEITKELKDLTQLWKPFDDKIDPGYTKYRYSGKELYADAISVLFNDPDLLKEKAPEFYRGFFNWMDNKPEVRDVFFDLQKQLNAGDEEVFKQRYADLDKNYKTGEDKWMAMETEKRNVKFNLVHMLNVLFNDKNTPILKLRNEAIKKGQILSPDKDPLYDLSGLNYMEGKIKQFVAKNFQPALVKANEVANGWSDVGKILQLERAIYERGELANPGGYDPKTAQWTLDQMEQHMSPENWAKLREAVDIFRKGVENFNKEAEAEGFYTPELQKQINENKAYAAFQVLDYLDLYVSSHVFKQKGTLKGIANPATTTVMKVVSTMRAMRYNRSKINNIEFLSSLEGEVEPAKLKFNGRSMVPAPPKDRTKDLVVTIENGKYKGYYVNKEVGMVLNHSEEPVLRWLAQVSKAVSRSSFYRPIFTSLNVGFQLFNAKKDFDRAWRNMPDENVGQAITSFFKLAGNYVKASPTAMAKAKRQETALLAEMENLEIFSINRSDLYGEVDPESDQIMRTMQKIGVLPETEKQSKLKKFLWPVVKLGDSLELLGNYIEALPKVAGYTQLKGTMSDKELAYYVRNYLGSPDFMTFGAATPVTNSVFLFSNAIKEGTKGDLNMAFSKTRKGSRGAWWFKMMLGTVLPKMLQIAMAAGLFGLVTKKMFDNVSEYDKTNYDILPLGVDKNGKTRYIRIPKDESGRFVGALVWKGFNLLNSGDREAFLQNISDIFSLGAGQFPNLTPSFTGTFALMDYLSGNNPWDSFRNRNVIPDTAFKAGFKYSWPYMLQWLANNQGGSLILPAYKVEDENASLLEKVINLPILSNMLGRFVRVSDYGQQEIDAKIKAEIEMKAAQKTMRRNEVIDAAVSRGTPPTLDEINKVLGHELDPKNKDDAQEVVNLMKKYEVQSLVGQNVYLDNLIYAGTNEAKVQMLQRYQDSLSGEEFYNLLKVAADNKILSSDALKQFSEAQKDQPKKLLNFDFNLVKDAYAAENNQDLYNKLSWSTDTRNAWQKFLGKAQAIITGNPNADKIQEGIAYDKLNSDQRRMYYETMLSLRKQDPEWYYQHIGNEVEKRILGFDLGQKDVVMKSLKAEEEAAKATPTPTKQPVLTKLATPTATDPAPTDTPYNEQIKKIFGDKWVEATKVLRYTDENGIIRGENTQLLSGPEIDIPNHIDKNGNWNDKAPIQTFKNRFTGKTEDSVDRGLFRINNKSLFEKGGKIGDPKIRAAMVDAGLWDEKYKNYQNVDQAAIDEIWSKMLNVEDNIKMAKIIYDYNGWSGWFAAPPEFRK